MVWDFDFDFDFVVPVLALVEATLLTAAFACLEVALTLALGAALDLPLIAMVFRDVVAVYYRLHTLGILNSYC